MLGHRRVTHRLTLIAGTLACYAAMTATTAADERSLADPPHQHSFNMCDLLVMDVEMPPNPPLNWPRMLWRYVACGLPVAPPFWLYVIDVVDGDLADPHAPGTGGTMRVYHLSDVDPRECCDRMYLTKNRATGMIAINIL